MGINAVLVGSRGTTSTTSLTTGAGTTSASGSTFVYLTSYDATTTANTPTDSKGNTYVQKSVTLASGTGDKCQVWVCENGTGGASHTATQTYSGNAFAVGYLVEITGATTTPTDIAVNGIDAATPFTISTGTLAQANEVVITICMNNQSVSGTNTYSSSNTTILDQEPNGAAFWTSAVSKLITSSTAAVSPSFTDTQGTAAAMIAVSFKEGTSTTTSPVTGPAISPMLGNKALGPLGLAGFALKGNIGPTAQNVSVALTGQAATFAAGTLTPSTSVALTGQAATFALGTLSPASSKALTGQAITSAVGTLTPNTAVGLTGQSATFAGGILSTGGDVTVALTGQAATFSGGILAPSTTIALTGGAASFAAGNLLATPTVALTGVAATSAVGALAPGIDTLLTGLSATFTAGILGVAGDVTVALTGLSATFTAGQLSVLDTTPPPDQIGGSVPGFVRKRKKGEGPYMRDGQVFGEEYPIAAGATPRMESPKTDKTPRQATVTRDDSHDRAIRALLKELL